MSKAPIRSTVAADLPALKQVIDAVELFPSEMLDDMFAGGEGENAFWLTYDDGVPAAIAYCVAEPMTEGTCNLLLIAVHPDRQGEGIGTQIMAHVEALLAEQGVRVLLVETSGTEHFVKTRAFYSHLGYDEEARIREYYDVGDDKVVFRKALSSNN